MLYSASQRRVLAASPLVFAAVATALLVFSISHRVVAITPITTVAAKAAAAAAGSGGSGADNGALTPVATSYVAAVTEQAGLEMTPAPDTSHTMCHDMYCMAENAVCCRNRRFCCPKGTVCGFSEPLPTSRPKCLGVFDNTGKRVTVDAIRLLNTGAALNIVLPKNVPTPNTSGGKVVIDGAPEPKLEFVLENTEVTVNGKL